MAVLDAEEREELPKKDFALPKEKSDTGGSGGYPIPDEEHAKSALARVKANGSPEEIAEVKRKVHAKFPDMDVEGMPEKKAKSDFHTWMHSPARKRE